MGVREKQEKNFETKGDLGFLGVGFSPRESLKSTRIFGAQSWPKGPAARKQPRRKHQVWKTGFWSQVVAGLWRNFGDRI